MERGRTICPGETMLTCSEVESLLDDYLDADIDPRIRGQIESHLAECETCSGLFQDCRRIADIARTLADQPVPASVSRRLRERLSEETGIVFGSGGLRVLPKNTD